MSVRSTGIAVYSRLPVALTHPRQASLAARWINVTVSAYDVVIAALHISGSSDKPPKAKMWKDVLKFAKVQRERRIVLIGDLNTGLPRIDERARTFHCWTQFLRLSEFRYVDAWRQQNGAETREFSWYSPQGNGFRLDHVFVSEALAPTVNRCAYSHDVRETTPEQPDSRITQSLDLTLRFNVATAPPGARCAAPGARPRRRFLANPRTHQTPPAAPNVVKPQTHAPSARNDPVFGAWHRSNRDRAPRAGDVSRARSPRSRRAPAEIRAPARPRADRDARSFF